MSVTSTHQEISDEVSEATLNKDLLIVTLLNIIEYL